MAKSTFIKRFLYESLISFRFIKIKNHNNAINLINDLKYYSSKNRRIFVIGNGPSINTQNLNLLKDEFTICSNAFYLKYKDLNWRPNIIICEDILPAKDNKDFYNSDEDSLKIFPIEFSSFINNRNSSYFINLKRTYFKLIKKPLFSKDFTKKAFWGGTVSYLSLQVAYYFQPKEIYLIGTDLSYNIPKNAKVSKDGVITSMSNDPNHFDPTYFGVGKKWHFPETDRMQFFFDYAFYFLKRKKISLINATNGGNLKNIPRKEFESIFK